LAAEEFGVIPSPYGAAGLRRLAGGVLVALLAPVIISASAVPAAAAACASTAGQSGAAATLAQRCAQRVEVLSARTPETRMFANPDGTSTLEVAAQPQRVQRPDGSWVPLDLTLTTAVDGSVVPTAVLGDLRFSGGGSAPLVTLRTDGGTFTLGWPGVLPAPSLAGDTATYANVLPDVDLQVTATATGFRHALVVRTPAAAKNPALDDVGYALGGVGLEITTAGDGTMVAKGAGGVPAVWSQPAAMWEAQPAGERSTVHGPGDGARHAAVTTKVERGRLGVRPDLSFLRGPATRFPVFIDPPFSYVAPSSSWAYANNHDATNSDTTVARVGLDPADGVLYRSFFDFPMSSGGYNLAGARIISAKVDATLYHSWSCVSTLVTLWHSGNIMSTPRTAYSPGLVGYLDQQSNHAHKGSNDCGDQPNVNMSFAGNLAADLQSQINGGANHYTVAFSAKDSAGNGETTQDRWKKFLPSTVVLSVQFNHVPATPSLGQLSIDPSYACSTVPVRVNGRNGLTLRATLADADNDSLTPVFTVDGVGSQYVHPMGPAVPGSFTATVDAAGLADGSAHTWNVKAGDGVDTGAASPGCPFVVDDSVPGTPAAGSTDLALGTSLIVPGAAAGAVVGQAGAVTVTPAAGDANIGGYLYSVSPAGPSTAVVWVPARGDGTATLPVVPVDATKVNFLSIQARNLTGQLGGTVTYKFNAHAGPSPAPHKRGDATGDGKADPFMVAGFDGGSGLFRWTTNTAGTGVTPPSTPTGPTGYASGTQLLPGDIDGDGKADLATVSQPGAAPFAVAVALSDGNADRGQAVDTSAWLVNSSAGTVAPQLANAKVVVADFTGDGRDDLGFGYNATPNTQWDFWVVPSTSTPGLVSFGPPARFVTNPNSNLTQIKLLAGDFNADGKADLMEANDSGNCTTTFYLHLSTGTSMPGGTSKWASGANGLCAGSTSFLTGDFNGDGHSDVAGFVDKSTCHTDLRTWLTVNGSDVAAPTTPWSATGIQFWCQGLITPSAGDLDGDGRDDIAVAYGCCNKQVKLQAFHSTGTGFAAPALWWEGGVGPLGTGNLIVDPAGKYQLYAGFSGLCLGIGGASTTDGTQFTEQTCSNTALNTQVTFERFGAGGYYHVHPAHNPGMCLAIASNGSSANATPLVQTACNGSVYHQMWQLNYVGGTGDIVVNVQSNATGKCGDVLYGGTAVGTGWIEYDCHGGNPQEYHLRRIS